MTDLRSLVRTIPGYPKPGILFRDITTLLLDPAGFRDTIDRLAARYPARWPRWRGSRPGLHPARALAHALGAGFIPILKRGKLPSRTIGCDYALEYAPTGRDARDAVERGDRVLLVGRPGGHGGTHSPRRGSSPNRAGA